MIGCGFFAQFQAEAWARMGDLCEISAVCDVDPARAAAFAEKYGFAGSYSSVEEMLDTEQPDFVDIVTRPDSHKALVQQAASRDIDILCQKPFAPTLAEAEDILLICDLAGVRLMVNENWRFQAWYREVKGLLDASTIGEPFWYHFAHRMNDGLLETPYPNQPYFKDYPKFLIYETLVHYLDTARYLFGDAARLYCETSRVNHSIAGEDLAMISQTYPSGLHGVIDGNRCSSPDDAGTAMGCLRIDGRGGSLWVDGAGRITIEPRDGVRFEHPWDVPPLGYRGDSCYNTQRHFIECLKSGEEFETAGRKYLKTFDLVFDCYRSAESGVPVLL